MKIVQKSSFTYPPAISERWKGEVFQPLVDHKFRLLLSDGNAIEAGVFELLVSGTKEIHACISTQAGCKFGCAMCTSGRNGFVRNLTEEEILTQIQLLSNDTEVAVFDHAVFMGIGEPLDNYDNFVGSVARLVSKNASYYAGRLSFATVGLPQRLLRLLREPIPAFRMLWVSIHAPTDEKRVRIMPVDKAFPVREILDAARTFADHMPTEVWINYMLFRGFNDGINDAESLAGLLLGTEDIFSVMITEPNNDLSQYQGADVSDLKRFGVYLQEAGVKNRVARFIAAGKQVNAGCGEFIFTRA
ncbi:MAG: radical SAM protein [Candidatus Moraniibacteriota bacterium]